MNRLSQVFAAIEAAYAGTPDTKFFTGPVNDGRHDNVERIVHWSVRGAVGIPRIGSVVDRSDRTLRMRAVQVRTAIWSATRERAEDRLCAFIVALVLVLDSCDLSGEVGDEVWALERVVKNGSRVDLAWTVSLPVVMSDARVVAEGIPPGTGYPTVQPTTIGITGILENAAGDHETTAGTVVITPASTLPEAP